MDSPPAKEDGNKLNLTIKFSGQSIPVEIAANSTVKDVKYLLQSITNVLPRGQKLIFKGRVLSDEFNLEASGVCNGSKIMLVASQGLHQGDGSIKREAEVVPNSMRATNANKEKSEAAVTKNQLERWKATGVIALSDRGLTHIPEEIWACGPSARVLDVSQNSILEVPATVGSLKALQKLLLHGNSLSDESVSWEGLTSLKYLLDLSLNKNNLTTLPSSIGVLTFLKQLDISSNKVTSIPAEIGSLTELQVLKADNNRLQSVPATIGGCVSLTEVNLSRNLLTEVPETISSLKNLKALYLNNNGLKALPNTLFKMCLQLSTLEVHSTEITTDQLRQFEGWGSFDERRRLKHQKQLDFGVTGGSADFDEGADRNW